MEGGPLRCRGGASNAPQNTRHIPSEVRHGQWNRFRPTADQRSDQVLRSRFAEKVSLKAAIQSMLDEEIEIPLIIGGKEVRTGNTAKAVCPHDHQHVLGVYHKAGEKPK